LIIKLKYIKEKNNIKKMNVKETFLRLTTHTVPYNKEIDYLKNLLPMNILKEDPVGNLFVKIGNSNTMFAAHLDTVGGDVPVEHVIEGNIIKTDGKSILGADDKAGVVVLLYMIEAGIPGMYTFFLGEEVGCKGSRALSSWIEKNKNDVNYKNINKVVSFDRKDVDSVITYQMSERTCSDEFADSLIKELGSQGLKFRKDTGGILTDSVQFTDLYAECTNLSVGYWSQHTNAERQDIEFLDKLCVACTKVDWDNLTIKRKPGETERLSYGRSNSYSGRASYNDWDDYEYGNYMGGSGANYNWNNTRSNTYSSTSKSSGEYVTDWRGDTVKADKAVWCEFDKKHCLKDEAIWVDLLGFYTTPDENTKRKTTSITTTGNSDISKSYNDNKSPELKSGDNFTPNMKIIHPTFGEGEVINKTPDGKKVEIKFKDGRKTLLVSVAKMKRI